jgi:ribosomal protein L1
LIPETTSVGGQKKMDDKKLKEAISELRKPVEKKKNFKQAVDIIINSEGT